jgi:F0F1-type ATP synthase membrane subunit b/b'
MAELNLVPNLTVVAVQTGIFITNLVIVKKLIVEPYFVLREKRDAMTSGAQGDAARLLSESESMSKKIEERLLAASTEANTLREKTRQTAVKQAEEIRKAAETETKAAVTKVTAEIAAEVAKQRAGIPEAVKKISEEVYSLAVN